VDINIALTLMQWWVVDAEYSVWHKQHEIDTQKRRVERRKDQPLQWWSYTETEMLHYAVVLKSARSASRRYRL